jgi:hypothetical protein
MSLIGSVARMGEKSIQNSEERDHFEDIGVKSKVVLVLN